MAELDGKVAVISGAARGQGRSHALRLAGLGADIIALDICRDIETMDYPNASAADLQETVDQVEALDRRIQAYEVDVRDVNATTQAIDAGVAALGRLDIVLPNAGIVRYHPETSIAEGAAIWADIVGTNMTGVYHVVASAIPHLIAGGRGGSIVMTGSVGATRPTPTNSAGSSSYIAAKSGLIGLMKTYALALGKHNIRVNIVHPTGVASGMTMNDAIAKLHEEAAAGGDNWISQSTNVLDVQLLQPGDITDAIEFLVSDKAKWITGASLVVDAGFTLK
jgi:SDR family mycofactocin-dependent oxidoreductase